MNSNMLAVILHYSFLDVIFERKCTKVLSVLVLMAVCDLTTVFK